MSLSLHGTTTEAKRTKNVLIFDYDGDGDLDVVAANEESMTSTEKADFYSNDGSANFSLVAPSFGSSDTFTRMRLGDVNNDGLIDMIAQRVPLTVTTFHVFINGGGGAFTETTFVPSPMVTMLDFALADFTADGKLDILGCPASGSSNSVLLGGNGNGTFTSVNASTLTDCNKMASGDVNGDGYTDVVVNTLNSPQLRVYLNSGTGGMNVSSTRKTGSDVTDMALTDIDNNGTLDILFASGAMIESSVNTGGGSFTSWGQFGSSFGDARSLAVGDMDNDGDSDVYFGLADPAAINGANAVWLNLGGGTFTLNGAPTEPGDCSQSVAVGDLDGDGDLDTAVGNYNTACTSGGNNRFYVSDQSATLANTTPFAPSSGFTVTSNTGGSTTTASAMPLIGSDYSGTGSVSWTGTSNITSSNSVPASATLTYPEVSHYLLANNFGFSIPTYANIAGIRTTWRRGTPSFGGIVDAGVRMIKSGIVQGDNKASVANWYDGLGYADASYGGTSDTWGVNWTASDINTSSFGAAIAAKNTLSSNVETANVDSVTITVYYYTTTDLTLRWGSGSDTETPTRQLQYQVRVGNVASGYQILSDVSGSPDYTAQKSSNAKKRVLRGVSCNQAYYWAVRTVDGGMRISGESAEQTISVNADCTVPGGGGGGTSGGSTGGGGGSSVGGGGGVGYWLGGGGNGDTQTEELNAVPTGTLKGKIFVDVNGNGKQEQGERGGFGGVRVEVEGTDIRGESVSRSVVTDTQGAFVLAVPAGSYHVRAVETGGKLSGFAMVQADGVSVTVEGGAQAEAWVGVRSQKFVGTSYKPCLQVGAVETDGTISLAQALLNGLETIYGQKLVGEEGLQGPLVSRKQFFELLTGTQCLKLEKSGEALKQQLRSAAKERGWAQAVLHDAAVPEGLGSGWRSSVYALLAAGVPAGRSAGKELVADPEAPITKREAMAMVAAVLKLEVVTGEEVALPPDALESDKEAGVFGALKKIGVLPKGFEVALAGGMTPSEASELLVKAAFAGGKLAMTAAPDEEQWEPAGLPEYLEAAGVGARRACLVQDGSRALAVRSDVLPNAPGQLFQRLNLLLSLGVKDEEGRFRWLLTGSRPGEYGVRAGIIGIGERKPVTWAALSDIGMKFTCHPLESYQEALLRTGGGGVDVSQGGTANVIFAPDRLFHTPDGPGYVQRVVHSMQRPVRQFDLSPVTFAKELTLEPTRDIGGVVSLGEGSKMLASFILYTRVQEGVLGRVEAEGIMSDLSTAILSELSGVPKEEAWRKAGANKAQALTWSQLITVLSDVLGPEMADTPLTVLPQGEAWWGVLGR
jgi:hypothetical protein